MNSGSRGLLKPGQVLANRFTIEQELGRGGVGVVYRVFDSGRSERRALKLLHPEFCRSERAIVRFKREVETLRMLNHPSIVKVFDTGRVGGTLFFTMEMVDGVSLGSRLRERGPLSFDDTLRIVSSLADALDHAHPRVVHRDLCPENVMVTASGNIKLLDFGVAKLTEDTQGLTSVGINLGKHAYCAPEQRSNAAAVDHRADIYSLGAIIYELVTGKAPAPFAPPDTLTTGVHSGLDAIIRRALARAPADRFASAGDLSASLAQLHVDAADLSRPTREHTV